MLSCQENIIHTNLTFNSAAYQYSVIYIVSDACETQMELKMMTMEMISGYAFFSSSFFFMRFLIDIFVESI